MRPFLSVTLIAVLTACSMPALAGGSDPREQALAIRTGSPVEVRLTDNTKVRGRLVSITEVDLEPQLVKQAGVANERIRFDKVKSVRDCSVRKGFVILGIVIGIVVVVTAVACGHTSCGG